MHDPGMTEECVDAMLSIALDDGQRFSSHLISSEETPASP